MKKQKQPRDLSPFGVCMLSKVQSYELILDGEWIRLFSSDGKLYGYFKSFQSVADFLEKKVSDRCESYSTKGVF